MVLSHNYGYCSIRDLQLGCIIIYAKGRATKGQMDAVRLFWGTLPDAAPRMKTAELAEA